MTGKTVGGLALRGWMWCDACQRGWHAGRRALPDDETWTLAGSGRSLNAGGWRVRAEGGGDPTKLMARLVRLPELERALAEIAAGAADPVAIALAALGAM